MRRKQRSAILPESFGKYLPVIPADVGGAQGCSVKRHKRGGASVRRAPERLGLGTELRRWDLCDRHERTKRGVRRIVLGVIGRGRDRLSGAKTDDPERDRRSRADRA